MEYLCVILLLLCSTILHAGDVAVVGVVGEDLILPCSIKPTNALDMEVTWYRGTDVVVHQYEGRQDKPDQQHSYYRSRTSLFGPEELQTGNISLKITAVKLTDTDVYKCQIHGQSGHIGTKYVEVEVEAVGSTPNISYVSFYNGSVTLKCESTGWSSVPHLELMGSEGQNLSAEPTVSQRFSGGYKVIRTVIVEKSAGTSFLCRVSTQIQGKEEKITVPDLEFGFSRHHYSLIPAILLSSMTVCAMLIPWRRSCLGGNTHDTKKSLEDTVSKQREENEQQREEIKRKDGTIKQKDGTIKQKDDTIKQKDDTIKQKDDTIKQKDDAIKQQREENKQKDDTIKQKDDTIKQQREENKQKDDTIKQQREENKQKDEENEQLRKEIEQLKALQRKQTG